MGDVYAVLFDATGEADGAVEAQILDTLRDWVGDRWPIEQQWFDSQSSGSVKAADGSIFRWEPFSQGDSFLHEFTWRHPDRLHPDVAWSTQLSAVRTSETMRFSVRVSNSGPDFPDAGALLTTRPRLIPALADRFSLRVDRSSLRRRARRLAAGEVSDFVRYELFDSGRALPIVVITPGEDGKFIVEPDRIVDELLSLGEVCCIPDADSTFALTSVLGRKELSCFHGAMRVYLPGLRANSDPREHPLILPRRAAERRDRLRLAQFLAVLTTRRYRGEARIQHLRDERAVAREARRAALERSLSTLQGKDTDAQTWRQLAEDYDSSNRQLKLELDALKEENRAIVITKDALARNLRRLRDARGIDEGTTPILAPDSLVEAVQQAQLLHSEYLNILPTAATAAEDSPYRDPGDASRALGALAQISARSKQGPLGRNLKDVFAELGLDYRPGISPKTPKRLREQHVFTDGVREYECFEHLCFGSSYDPADCLRIYFTTARDDAGRWTVGHVGRHLDTLSTT